MKEKFHITVFNQSAGLYLVAWSSGMRDAFDVLTVGLNA